MRSILLVHAQQAFDEAVKVTLRAGAAPLGLCARFGELEDVCRDCLLPPR